MYLKKHSSNNTDSHNNTSYIVIVHIPILVKATVVIEKFVCMKMTLLDSKKVHESFTAIIEKNRTLWV